MPSTPRILSLSSPQGEDNLTDQERNIIEFRQLSERFERSINSAINEYASLVGLTLLEGLSLQAIYDLGEQAKVGAIAEQARIPLSTMTGVARRLETDGLVSRHRAPDDGRAFILRLTEEGAARLEGMFVPLLTELNIILEDEDPESVSIVLEGFRRVAELGERLEKKARALRAANT